MFFEFIILKRKAEINIYIAYALDKRGKIMYNT